MQGHQRSDQAGLYYTRFIWLTIMYFLGVYIQKDGKTAQKLKNASYKATAASAAAMVFSIVLIDHFHTFFSALGTTEPAYFWPPNTIPMVFLSVGIFGIFLNLKIQYFKGIHALASTTLGIYLLHDGVLTSWLWDTVFRCAEYQNSSFLVFRILMTAVIIFIVGAVIDLFRQMLGHWVLDRLIDSVIPEDNIDGGAIMKNMTEHLSVFKARFLRLFCVVFLMYLFLGMCISYHTAFDTNMFFGADNARAFWDLTNIVGTHDRIKVHPLFLLLAETVTLLVNGVINRLTMSVIFVESFCGALSVSMFDAILRQKGVGLWIRNIFTLIFAFSFSMIIFSTVPETFIFAALGLISFWYFLSIDTELKGPFSKRETFLLIFFGVVCCGVTLTNYCFYLLGLIYLLLCRYPLKKGAKMFLKINGFNVAAIISACFYQRFVWKQAPLFWTSIFAGISGQPYQETQYMNWTFSYNKTTRWIKEVFFRPILSPDMYLNSPGEAYHPILFQGYTAFIKIVLVLFYIMLIAGILLWILKLFKSFSRVSDGYIVLLMVAYAGNLALHYIYGYNEAFMYSPHYLFYILLAMPLMLNRCKNSKINRVFISGLIVFCVVEVINNLTYFIKTAQIALSTVGASLNLVHALKGTIMCGGFLLIAILLWQRSHFCTQSVAMIAKTSDMRIHRFCCVVKVYGSFLLLVSLWIAFNY